jgi:hypothetical protein
MTSKGWCRLSKTREVDSNVARIRGRMAMRILIRGTLARLEKSVFFDSGLKTESRRARKYDRYARPAKPATLDY